MYYKGNRACTYDIVLIQANDIEDPRTIPDFQVLQKELFDIIIDIFDFCRECAT